MLIAGGAAIVLLSVVGGFVWEGGQLLLLSQPAEFVIIGGAALGGLLIGSPPKILKMFGTQLGGAFGAGLTRDDYAKLLAMLYQLFRLVQQTGVMALESHFENPGQSAILSRYPGFLARHHSVGFLSDSVKVIIVGGMSAHDLDALMEEDLQVHHDEAVRPSAMLNRVGDALPGLGIVAAVLGVVLTMQAIDGPAAEIGHKVGAALVGTFLGILLSYGFAQPLAANLEARVGDDSYYEKCIRAGLLACYKGFAPAIAVEFARRVLPNDVRPTFDETEALCKATRGDGAQAAA
ncbi:MAG: flagellar motor stator protein MotA [Acidobacteria bacterium]|nr:flagellar motor stator protein MotA [Acidobacteriota bacterium]